MVFEGATAPGLDGIEAWINSDGITVDEETLLLDFWNYSCHSCSQRLGPMHEFHTEHPGIKVVGVHTPRFRFERKRRNVERAVEKRGVSYPVAVDDGSAWRAFGGYNWPVQAVVEDGRIRWKKVGGADMEELSRAVSDVLGVEHPRREDHDFNPDVQERHLGYRWGSGFNGSGNFRGERDFEAPSSRAKNRAYLEGSWRQEEEYLEAGEDAKLFFPSGSSNVSVVAGPGGGIRDIRVLRDGEEVGDVEAGEDLRDDSSVRVRYPELYRLIDSAEKGFELTLEPETGTRLYSITRH